MTQQRLEAPQLSAPDLTDSWVVRDGLSRVLDSTVSNRECNEIFYLH